VLQDLHLLTQKVMVVGEVDVQLVMEVDRCPICNLFLGPNPIVLDVATAFNLTIQLYFNILSLGTF